MGVILRVPKKRVFFLFFSTPDASGAESFDSLKRFGHGFGMASVPARKSAFPSLLWSLPDGRVLICSVRRSARAHRLRLTVSAGGEVALVTPERLRLSVDRAREILDAHAAWISRAVHRAGEQAVAPPELPARIALPAAGMKRRVELCPATEPATAAPVGKAVSGTTVRVHDDGARLLLSGATENPALCCAALQRWLTAQARPLLVGLVADMSARTGLEAAGVQIRGQRTRWGSCSHRRVLSLNYRLALLPEAQIRYLILHELCHLRHMNHSPAYRAFLAGFEPRWKECERELLRAWRDLPRWCREAAPGRS